MDCVEAIWVTAAGLATLKLATVVGLTPSLDVTRVPLWSAGSAETSGGNNTQPTGKGVASNEPVDGSIEPMVKLVLPTPSSP